MNRTRMLILGVVALVLSVGVSFLAYRFLQDRLQPPEQMTSIVVVLDKIPLGTRLTKENLRVVSWPKSVPLQGSFSDPAELVGRGNIVPLEANEPVLEAKLAAKEAGAGLMTAIPDGMRAVAVRVNDVINVAGFVVPGARVDLILVGTPPNGSSELAKVVLENVIVLAAGQNVARDSEGKPQQVGVITLLVTPEDSEKLALMASDRIQFALRHPLDQAAKNPPPVLKMSLYTGAPSRAFLPPPAPAGSTTTVAASKKPVTPAPAPAPVVAPPTPPPPPQFHEVQLIEGSNVKSFKFEKKP